MRSEKNEHIALIVGFVLILLVIILTLFRNNPFSPGAKNTTDSTQATSSDNSINNLPSISSKDLQKKILLNKDDFAMLDVRDFQAYAGEHIMDVINIPLDEFPVGQKLDSHKQVVIIGADGADTNTTTAYEKLKQEDFTKLVVLAGGMNAWKSLIGATVTYGNPKSFVDQTKVSYIDPEQLNDAIKAKAPMFIVDVRSREDFARGHVTGAINIPFDNLEKERAQIKEKKVVVLGINELQEFQASVQMYDMLLVQPFIVRGAMPKWQEKSFPVITQ